MDTPELKQWLSARRGRLSTLARAMELDRQFIWQWARDKRPIPKARLSSLRAQMRKIERQEKTV